MRSFTDIGLTKVPEKTIILNFRHLLERHGLGQVLFESIKNHLADEDLMLKKGRILDASIFAGPPRRRTAKESGTLRYSRPERGTSGPSI